MDFTISRKNQLTIGHPLTCLKQKALALRLVNEWITIRRDFSVAMLLRNDIALRLVSESITIRRDSSIAELPRNDNTFFNTSSRTHVRDLARSKSNQRTIGHPLTCLKQKAVALRLVDEWIVIRRVPSVAMLPLDDIEKKGHPLPCRYVIQSEAKNLTMGMSYQGTIGHLNTCLYKNQSHCFVICE